ncbi:peptidase M28 family peptidase [Candidatus Magnetobacterium bavaricum]|uniref:Peptidase M28 family peptidase n=1 Tax=Candidatus Magnetobacterium bavaricum TaxID=29290 RepID=A0A0F3GSD9_9BACT|nr:peptidase M28 family peptidase [Candidatus Magnetobacterium bavaricum]
MDILPSNKGVLYSAIKRWGAFFIVVSLVLVYMVKMPGKSYHGGFEPPTAQEQALSRHLRAHVDVLAGDIGERNLSHYKKLQAAAAYIKQAAAGLGLKVTLQGYLSDGKSVENIEIELKATPNSGNKTGAEEIIVIGAHYDSALFANGANDNASGVAAVLEIARMMADKRPTKTIRFVFFVNHEMPYFQTDNMGSLVYAKRAKKQGDNIIAMFSLETIGFYTDKADSQKYPFPFSLFYPSTGNFIAFVSNFSYSTLLRKSIREFRKHTRFPSEGVIAPGKVQGIDWSDHWAFWQAGYRAIMITDTAIFRYEHYHLPTDTPDKIDYERLSKVVLGIYRMISGLAGL